MIPEGTLIAAERVKPVEELEDGIYVYMWDVPRAAPSSAAMSFEAHEYDGPLLEVECWFHGNCKNCLHSKNKGSTFLVGPSTRLLLKNGDYFAVEDLQNGHRLRVIGCSCGYEEVKQITEVGSRGPTHIYSVEGNDNYGIRVGDHTILLASD